MSRKPGRIFAIAGAVTALAVVAGAGWVTWDAVRPRPTAPPDPGVCWRMTAGVAGPRFKVVNRHVENLESCAATLEAIYLNERRPVQGAYQSRFILIDEASVDSAERLDGARWRIFWGAMRERIDKRLRLAQKRQAADLPNLPGLPELPEE